MFAHRLKQPTRTASPTWPRGVIVRRRTFHFAVPIRFCSRCGLPCRLRCRIRGALLPHLFTLTSRRSFRGEGGRFVLCGTFPGVAPAGRYPAPYVDGARTFLPGHLSAIAGAAVRPTDDIGMGVSARDVKLMPCRGRGSFDRKRMERLSRPRQRPGCRAGSPARRAACARSIGRRCRRRAPAGNAVGTRSPLRVWAHRSGHPA